MSQNTIKRSIGLKGVGLHTGKKVKVTFHPASPGQGILFVKKVKNRLVYIRPDVKNVVSTEFATNLGTNGEKIGTVEHLLAALRGLGISDLIVEVQGDEIPVLDGSAKPFLEALGSAGITSSDRSARKFLLKKNVVWGDFNRWIRAYPARGFKVDYIIDFSHPLIGQQVYFYNHSVNDFKEKIAPARTFGFLKDAVLFKKKGLARGGSLENAVVFDDKGVVNPGGLRFADEPVRHKLLDFIGDLSLVGGEIEGYFQVYCSGHAFNASFVKYLLQNRHEYLDEVYTVPSISGNGYVYERVVASVN